MTKLLDRNCHHGTLAPFGQKGDDQYGVMIPAGEVFDGCLLTITGQRLNAGARVDAQPAPGQTGASTLRVHWWFDGGSEIAYRIEAYSRKAEAPAGLSVRVPGFLPSTHGFQFKNKFTPRPDLVLRTAFGNLEVGNATNGLCGGMVYAVRDHFEARVPVPPGATPPEAGPLFDYLVHRLFDSFDLPGGVARYLELMHPALPDHETDLSRAHLAPHGRAWRMIVEEWPLIRQDLDAGRLSPLGLVCLKSANPAELGRNHQVLAYGYELQGTRLSLRIYDPNLPQDDTVWLSLDIGTPDHTTPVVYLPNPVIAFFRTTYRPELPPGCEAGARVRAALRAQANGRLVCAENAGALPLIANRDRIGLWETFEIRVVGSNRIALKSAANGRFVCAENAGAKPLVANRAQVGPWETFELEYLPGNRVALRAVANRQLVCAEDAGAKPLTASRAKAGTWESFEIVPL
jgi:hypothetical protein